MTKDTPDPIPALKRIRVATIAAPDVDAVSQLYCEALDYQLVDKSTVSAALARSWHAPNNAGANTVLLAPAHGGDVYIRAVQIDAMPNYRPMTSYGWNSIEIVVDDVYAVREKIAGSGFKIIGEPHALGGAFASIYAMQVIGPANEVLYLTCETGDRNTSPLPIPRSPIDRPFIMILTGPDIETIAEFYVGHFGLGQIPNFSATLTIASQSLGLPAEHQFRLGLLRARDRGNNIELDEYPASAGARQQHDGQLPPGVAMTSFTVNSLDAFDLPGLSEAVDWHGTRAASFIGPAGELTELIEEPD